MLLGLNYTRKMVFVNKQHNAMGLNSGLDEANFYAAEGNSFSGGIGGLRIAIISISSWTIFF